MPSIIKVDQIQSDTGNVAISGNVSSTLRVSNTSFPLIVRSGGTNHITMFDTRSSTGVGTMIGANQDGNTYYDSNYNGTATAGGHIWRSGGSDILTLGATGLLTTTAGIKFPATQNPSSDANTLDDYEEGTFTPTLAFGSASGTTGITYSERFGIYVKVGQLCWIQVTITLTSKGSSTGIFLITNLPFTQSSISGHRGGGTFGYFANFTGVNGIPTTYGTEGSTQIDSYDAPDNTGFATNIDNTNVGNDASIRLTYTYRTNS